MCNEVEESIDHLFFRCSESGWIWFRVCEFIGGHDYSESLFENMMSKISEGRYGGIEGSLFRLTLGCTVYAIWEERNARMFVGNISHLESIVLKIGRRVIAIWDANYPAVVIQPLGIREWRFLIRREVQNGNEL